MSRHAKIPGLVLGAITLLLGAGCSVLAESSTGSALAPAPAPAHTVSATPTLPPEVTAEEMVNAPVPSLCDHPAGVLSDGELLAEDKSTGGAWISGYPAGDWQHMSFRSWRDEQGAALAALVVECSQGGVGWPPHVVFYTSGPKVLGEIDVSDVVGDGRQGVVDLAEAPDGVRLSLVNTYQEGDGACCGTLSVVADFYWDGTKARGRVVEQITEKPTAREAFAAALKGDRPAILQLFNKGGRAEALAFRKSVTMPDPDDWSSRVDCVALVDDREFAGDDRSYDRVCYFHTKDLSVGASVAMKWVGFGAWEAAGIQVSDD